MATDYPDALDVFTAVAGGQQGTPSADGRVHSARHNDVEDAVEAVQAELGVNPSGASATVAARLAAIPSAAAVLTPSGDATGVTDLAAFDAAIAAAMPTAGAIYLQPGVYYVNGPIVVQPDNPGTGNIPAPVPSIIGVTGAGWIGDMADTAAVVIEAASTFPVGSFMLDYRAAGSEYSGTGAAVSGFVMSCRDKAAGFRAQGPRKFHVSNLSIISPAAPVSPGDGATGAFSITQGPWVGDGGAYSLFENVSIDRAGQDSFCHLTSSADTFVNCESLSATRAAFFVQNSDATFVGCSYEQGQYAVWADTSAGVKFVALGSYSGASSWPTQNAVKIVAGIGSAATRYPSPVFLGCHLGNGPGAAPGEAAGAVVRIDKYADGLVQAANFVGCTFSAGANTSDWFYVETGTVGRVNVSGCTFRGSVTTNAWNDASGTLVFRDCYGITVPTAGEAHVTANTTFTTEVDLTGATKTITTPKGYLVVSACFDLNIGHSNDVIVGHLNVDGSNQSYQVVTSGGSARTFVCGSWVVPVSSGSHTLKLRAARASGVASTTANATHTRFTYHFVSDVA